MEKHACKLCFRSFGNGRALGGHMRSHVAASNKAAAAVQLARDASPSPASQSSSSSRGDDDDPKGAGMGYGLRENPKKSFRVVDPEFSSTFPAVDASSFSPAIAAPGSSVVVQDPESESESSRAPTTTYRRRSKRARKSADAQPDPPPAAAPEPEPVSSVSDTTPEEDTAISLMLMSRDLWLPVTKSDDHQSEPNHPRFFEDEEDEDEMDAARMRKNRQHQQQQQQQQQQVKGRSKYQCGTCKKVFRSYQALGGHRASHKKNNGCSPPAATPVKAPAQSRIHEFDSSVANVDRSHHECPVCFRVFSSGQALGGHKRSHLASTSAATITITSSSIAAASAAQIPLAAASGAAPTIAKHGESLIDLNLPAPMEDDAELSAVSDAEFVMLRSSS